MSKHPNKTIQQAVEYAMSQGWRFEKPGKSSHAWAIMKCPFNDKTCRCGSRCSSSVASTPRSAENHAKQIRRTVDGCETLIEKKKLER